MRIFRDFNTVKGIKNPVVTTGSFDGVHLGHKTILNRLKTLAQRYGGESVLITFDPHPRKVLYAETSGKDLKLINTQEEKLKLLHKAGLDNIIIVEFTREFSRITSEEFVRDFLHGILKAKVIVAGFNHHFGFNKEGDYRQLWGWREKYDFEAEEIPEQEVQNESVSSTKIRKAISEGYIQRANAYLDHYYFILGRVMESGTQLHHLPFPFLKINYEDESKLVPATGIYAASALTGDIITKAIAIIHNNSAGSPEVLLQIFGNEEAFKGNKSEIRFHKMIRGTVNLADSRAADQVNAAKAEILELIY